MSWLVGRRLVTAAGRTNALRTTKSLCSVLRHSTWVLSAALIGTIGGDGVTALQNNQNIQALTLQEHYRAARIRRFIDADRAGRETGEQSNSSDVREAIIGAAQSPDPYFRQFVLSAAVSEASCDPVYRVLLNRFLYDVERQNRQRALELVQVCYLADPALVGTLIDIATHDVSNDTRELAHRVFQQALVQLQESGDENTAQALEKSKQNLLTLSSKLQDQAQSTTLKAAGGDIDSVVEEIRSRVQPPVPQAPAPVSRTNTERVGDWLRDRSHYEVLVLASLAAVASAHVYYLTLLVFRPATLFALIYARYPAFVIPYAFQPNLYSRRIAPIAALLKALRHHADKTEYIRLIPFLVPASRRLRPHERERLARAVVEVIEEVDNTDARLALGRALAKIAPDEIDNLEYSDEDPEIKAARENMMKIMDLPNDVIDRPRLELAHALRQATTISADFYNVITRAADSYAIYMVDVDHHGLAASLDAMQVRFALKASRDWGLSRPCAELEAADSLLSDMTAGEIFAAMSFLEIDLANRVARFASAGMPPALLFRNGHPEPIQLHAAGVYVGDGYSFRPSEPREASAEIGDGDLIVVYSDGILETRDPDDHLFGDRRLVATINKHRTERAPDIVEAILEACRTFSGRVRPRDDQSVVVIRIKSASGITKASVAVNPVRIAEENDLRVRASLRKVADWPQVVNEFVSDKAIPFVQKNLATEAVDRFRIALTEAMYNAVEHGSDDEGMVTIQIAKLPASAVEAVISQQRPWADWVAHLGRHKQRELVEAVNQHHGGAEMPLGGTTMISTMADNVICDGRRLTIQFQNRMS